MNVPLGTWIPIDYQLPPHEKNVLLAVYHLNSSIEVHIGWYNHSKEIWRTSDGDRIEDVLYWMVLPEPPARRF